MIYLKYGLQLLQHTIHSSYAVANAYEYLFRHTVLPYACGLVMSALGQQKNCIMLHAAFADAEFIDDFFFNRNHFSFPSVVQPELHLQYQYSLKINHPQPQNLQNENGKECPPIFPCDSIWICFCTHHRHNYIRESHISQWPYLKITVLSKVYFFQTGKK